MSEIIFFYVEYYLSMIYAFEVICICYVASLTESGGILFWHVHEGNVYLFICEAK